MTSFGKKRRFFISNLTFFCRSPFSHDESVLNSPEFNSGSRRKMESRVARSDSRNIKMGGGIPLDTMESSNPSHPRQGLIWLVCPARKNMKFSFLKMPLPFHNFSHSIYTYFLGLLSPICILLIELAEANFIGIY